ncbi:hypothetical protein [Streptomyces galbus]|uniref:Uncharacterized protein n=1 Tax=Streptomyces galbus TaxID=33898 RepID=A0ABX1ILZ6_STRGB|nr:hypothetical protein [Streptomyces galbus]NKQ25401.1 hypothetical protein [Streptomyces galbus]
MTPPVVTLDPGLRDLRAADHLLLTLAAELALPEGTFGCTHLVRDDRPRVAVSLALPTDAEFTAVRDRLVAHGTAYGRPDAVGRAVLFPGAAALTGTTTVGEVRMASAIDRVTVLGTAEPPGPDTALLTRDHVRPQWQAGALVLVCMPPAGGTLVPFEVPAPTPSCADH